MNSNLHDTLQPDRPFRRRWRRALLPLAVGCFLAAWSVSPLWGQSAAVGLGGTVEDDAPVQILTSDLGRVQTINESHVAVTFVILGQSAIQRVAINGAE